MSQSVMESIIELNHFADEEPMQSPLEKDINPKPAFDLATSIFDLSFPVPWPNKEGLINVTHTLRRPTSEEETEYRMQMVFTSRQSAKKIKDEGNKAGEAMNWLWDQVAQSVSGYPGITGAQTVTPANAEKMRSTHKQSAVTALTACDGELLLEESEATLDGGEYVMRLRIGTEGKPFGIFKVRAREWTEKERIAYEKTGGISSTEVQGKTQLKTSGINPRAFTALFDAVFLSVTGDVLADGKTFSEAGRDAFIRHFLGEWKIEVVSQLTQFWLKNLSD